MKKDQTIDVLIVGAGPAGTTLAIDLVRRGLSVRIIDQSPHSFRGSRAKGIQPRTLEIMEDLEVIEDILKQGSLYPLLGAHLGPFTLPWQMFRNKPSTSDIPYPNTWLIPQFSTDLALHKRLEDLGVKVEFGHKLIDFSQNSEFAQATIVGLENQETVLSKFIIGADGGASTVRLKLDIPFDGTTDEKDRILIVDAVTTGLSRNRWHIWPGRGGKFVGACPLPNSDLFQWMIRLAQGEEPPADITLINERIHKHTGDKGIILNDIQWKSVFRPNIRLAQSYRKDRALIIGDAAHVHTPAGAQGLNTGIQDAYNLGWKIQQVLAGASDVLLNSYEAERQPIAAAVLGLSTKKYEGIAKLNPNSIRRGKDEQQLALTYCGGPLSSIDDGRKKALKDGDRAPDAELKDIYGSRIRLFEIFRGPHFTLISYGKKSVHSLPDINWPNIGAALKIIIIDANEKEIDYPSFHDLHKSFHKAYQPIDGQLILVRPDGYIGHISNSENVYSMTKAIRMFTPPDNHSVHQTKEYSKKGEFK
ncbi:FAD-dependent oxidoreductase [Leptospira sp. 96542]|nr:FAD-dependent oxidoreductase [Leptospira sp. 96542]